jgi:membrane protein YqaA with SNARE-associated domain
MLHYIVRTRILVVIVRIAETPGFPWAVGLTAFALTISMLFPFVPILLGAVAASRGRAGLIVALSGLGSAIGGVILYVTFHHLGWNQIAEAYPDLSQSKALLDAIKWMTRYGTIALFFIAASPLAQTPALIIAAISDLPVAEVFVALFFGKLIKYGVYAWVAIRFPHWVTHALNARV